MQAMSNIQMLNAYNIKTIVTACPHCFNTIKNEYPELGGITALHHSTYLQQLIDEENYSEENEVTFKGRKIIFMILVIWAELIIFMKRSKSIESLRC